MLTSAEMDHWIIVDLLTCLSHYYHDGSGKYHAHNSLLLIYEVLIDFQNQFVGNNKDS